MWILRALLPKMNLRGIRLPRILISQSWFLQMLRWSRLRKKPASPSKDQAKDDVTFISESRPVQAGTSTVLAKIPVDVNPAKQQGKGDQASQFDVELFDEMSFTNLCKGYETQLAQN